MKRWYIKKYGVFAWVKDSKKKKKYLVALGTMGPSKEKAKVFPSGKYMDGVLGYYRRKSSEYGLIFMENPFFVRITAKEVKLKDGILKLDWAKLNTERDGFYYVPFQFVPFNK